MDPKYRVLFLSAAWFGMTLWGVAQAAAYQNMGPDRILLMNNDSRPESQGGIVGQGYWDTNTTAGTTYWTHLPVYDNTKAATRTLQQGSEHVLHASDGAELWRLSDCRAGHIVESVASRNRLPYSKQYAMTSLAPSASFSYEGRTVTTISNAPNACVIMRNSRQAALHSPYYGEGVGTIYFDVVNSFPTTEETIQIQIATNLTEAAVLHNEANPADAVEFAAVHRTVPFEEWDDYYDWRTIPITALEIVGTSVVDTLDGSTNLVLNVTDTGDAHYFRVRTQLNYYGPIRFRVKRLTDSEVQAGSDTAGLVLIDNVIASYPPMTVKFGRLGGDVDPDLHGTGVLGCIGDFDKPFPSAGEVVNAQVNFSWVTNFQGTAMALRVTNPLFNYRWRYLDQQVKPWQTINLGTNRNVSASGRVDFDLSPQNTNLYTVAGIPLSDGAGDLEYYFTATVDAPYYRPCDYANDTSSVFGSAIGTTGNWTEEIAAVTNRMEVAEDFRTPALGRDYFTRIREGASDYKWVALCATVTAYGVNARSEECRMALVGDHTWRYHYYMPTNMVGETLAFHFKGEELFADVGSAGYQSRTNTWYCDSAERSSIPFSSSVGLGGRHEASCRFDGVSTHLLIEFNDETLKFSVIHAAYQNFNTWTDATAGYVGHANWNSEGATGVSDTKKKYTLDMSDYIGWRATNFESDYWHESFDTSDFMTYPWNMTFDEHRTPNGWTAGNGKFVRRSRDEDTMSLHLEGCGQGWVGMESFSDDMMPHGIDQVEFRARLAQEPRFEDFAWYMDGIGMSNYVFSARVSMSQGDGGLLYNPPDISPGTPSVSLVGYYRPLVGCYEFRITRSGQFQLCAAIYKWTQEPSGMKSTVLCSNVVAILNEPNMARPGPGQPKIMNFGNYLVGTAGSMFTASCAYLYIRRSGTTVSLRGGLSREWGNSTIAVDSQLTTLVLCNDTQDAFTKGSFGVGSTECQARFSALATHNLVEGTTDFDRTANYLNNTGPDWTFFKDRWAWSDLRIGLSAANLLAVVPTNQTIKLELKSQNDGRGWQPSGYETIVGNYVSDKYIMAPKVPRNYQWRLRTGGNSYDGLRTDVVVDDISVKSWQARNYPDLPYYNGQSFNWVYMQGVVEKLNGQTVLRLQPSRGLPEKAMGLRSPFLDNGISTFSFDYANADPNTRLLLQVCTNLVSVSGVSESLTTRAPPDYNWVTVKVWDFSTMSASELAQGTLTHYMSLRTRALNKAGILEPVKGLARLVVDSNVIWHCREEDDSATRQFDYGQVTITGAYCYDEPASDSRSWHAWNFHTAGWNTADKRFAYLFDSPDGLSGSLNFSALDADNKHPTAEGIGLVDRNDIAAYQANNSFVQCPPIASGIGSVSFRARTFDTNANHKAAWVTLYGSNMPDVDQVVSPESWTRITDFQVSNTTYQTFRWNTADTNLQFRAIRLEMAGCRHGRNCSTHQTTAAWERPLESPLQRVFLDEISVGEPTTPQVGFSGVRPFRSGVEDDPPGVVANVDGLGEQPLLGESWGLQCTVVPQVKGDEIVPESIKVYAAFFRGVSPWGYEKWGGKAQPVELDRIGDTLTFRSTINHAASIVLPTSTPSSIYPDNVWQYYVWCEFLDRAGNRHRHGLDSTDWTMPSWYSGMVDLNEQYRSQGFAGYTILDAVSSERVWICASVFGDHLHQDIGGRTNTIEIFSVPKGGSTNIVYRTDSWCQIGEATTNGVVIAGAQGRASRGDTPPHQWTLELPRVMDTLRVDVHEAPSQDVQDAGLAPTDPYYPAVMHWLAGLDGDDADGLHRAEMWDLANEKVGDLGLKEMYWLNIDPSDEGWVLKAGMGGIGATAADLPVQPVYVHGGNHTYTNVRVKVTMMVTNRITNAAWAPDRLQGLEPGNSSVDYGPGSPNWTGATFKMMGALRRPDDAAEANAFRPLRWFVFTPESFDENFQATIDLWDPYSENSMGRLFGWGDFPGVPVWYRWRIDDEPAVGGAEVEPLKARATYSE